jgi:hypothetical protein
MPRFTECVIGYTAILLFALTLMVACAIEGRIAVGTTPRSPCPQAEP